MERRYTALVLGKREVGETDRLYTFYTKESGKLRVVARGVRKPAAKLASQLETLVLAEVTVISGRGIGKVAGAVAENHFLGLRSNYQSLHRAFLALGKLERLVDLEEPDEATFSLALEYLELSDMLASLGNEGAARLLSQAFLLKLFERLGYGLEARSDAATGARLRPEGRYLFSPSAGGIVAEEAFEGSRDALPVGQNTIKLLRLIQDHRLAASLKIRADEKALGELEHLTRRFYRWITP
jgi:DNA repair protein RecO (recombination protein O)